MNETELMLQKVEERCIAAFKGQGRAKHAKERAVESLKDALATKKRELKESHTQV